MHPSTVALSPATSSNSSTIMACVSIGAWYHHHDSSWSRQKVPSSSLETDRSRTELTIAPGVSLSPNRFRPTAMWACPCRLASFSQYFRA